MTAHAVASHHGSPASHAQAHDLARFLVPLGRALFVAIFVMSGLTHFSGSTIAYAAQQGVPYANVLVPMSGVLALVGGLSILLGYKARLGAVLLVAFLIPVTLMMHPFWTVADASMAKMQQVMFMKNVSMLGAALILCHSGAGPISLDERRH